MVNIIRRVHSDTFDKTFREYLEEFAPHVKTDPSFQANDEDGRWNSEEQSSFLTSLVTNMAPSKFIFADVDTRVNRLLSRGMKNEDILNRIANQKNDDWWKSLGCVIHNNDLNNLQIELDKLFNHNS